MGWFIGIGIEIGIEIARIDDEVDSDSDSDSDFDALHEVAVDKLRIAGDAGRGIRRPSMAIDGSRLQSIAVDAWPLSPEPRTLNTAR